MKRYRIHDHKVLPLDGWSVGVVAMLKLSMVVAAADGRAHPAEISLIQQWGEKLIRSCPSGYRSQVEEYLNQELENATNLIGAGKEEELISGAVVVLLALGESWVRYEAYTLCVEVLVADGVSHPEEMAILASIAAQLDIQEKQARRIADGLIDRSVILETGGARERDQYLGITKDMDEQEIRRHLNALFRRYAARATHENPDLAERGRDWLERIGEARARHLGI